MLGSSLHHLFRTFELVSPQSWHRPQAEAERRFEALHMDWAGSWHKVRLGHVSGERHSYRVTISCPFFRSTSVTVLSARRHAGEGVTTPRNKLNFRISDGNERIPSSHNTPHLMGRSTGSLTSLHGMLRTYEPIYTRQ